MFYFSDMHRRGSGEPFLEKLTVSILCPKEGRHSCVPAARGDTERASTQTSQWYCGGAGSLTLAFQTINPLGLLSSVAPGEWGCEFLAAFSYLPNPFGCDGSTLMTHLHD